MVQLEFGVVIETPLFPPVTGCSIAGIIACQIAAVPTRHEPTTGELDDRRIFQEIDAIGYQGYVGCEYRPAGDTVVGLDWLRRP